MIYENKILPRLKTDRTCEISDVLQKIVGLEVLNFCSCDQVAENIRKESNNIIKHYLQSSDLLQFLSSASYHKAFSLKYNLNPPLTSSKLDCEYILSSLARAGYVIDYSFSSLTSSFWIEIDKSFTYTLRELVNIGICELLSDKYTIKYNVQLRSKTENIWGDVFVESDRRMTAIHIELAAGLETDISSHISQFEKLKSKILKAQMRRTEYFSEFIIITPTAYKQLPEVLQQSDCIITIDDIQTKLNNLEF